MADEKVTLSIKQVDGNSEQSSMNISYVNPDATDNQLHTFAEETLALSYDTLVSASRVETRELRTKQEASLKLIAGSGGGSVSSDDAYVSELRIKWAAFKTANYRQSVSFRLPGVVAPGGYESFKPVQVRYKLPTPFEVVFTFNKLSACFAVGRVYLDESIIGWGDWVDPDRSITVTETGTYEIEFYIDDDSNYTYNSCKLIVEP